MIDHTHASLTAASLELFKALVEDAPNWSGTPLITVSPSEKGNLSHLKRQGLLETFVEDDGCAFAEFTDKGRELAEQLGYDPTYLHYGS